MSQQDPTHADVLIVGAGHAGAACAANLRKNKFAGSILVIGDEAELPYERPPLSKAYLSREKSFDRLLLRTEIFWAENDIAFALGHTITRIDPDMKSACDSDGNVYTYGQLVWATGGTPRRLTCTGAELAGLHTIRTRTDVDRLMAELHTAQRVVVIGGGYIGLEAASVLTKLGCEVVLIEAQDRLLARVAGPELSAFFAAEHRRHRVDIRLGETVTCVLGERRAEGVQLGNGEVVSADLVIVGIGIVPAVGPLLEAGAAGGNGVDVDAQCRTTLPDVFAIGDCARAPNPFAGGAMTRLESVQNAHDQAMVVARVITGSDVAYESIPWFWSDQYDLKLQTVGLNTGYDQTVLRGDPDTRTFSVAYLKDRRLIAIDAVNAPRDYMAGRMLITATAELTAEEIADTSVELKDRLKR